jgi:hypothetical protein
MHFAKANDVALTFAMACNKMCRRWKAVSKDSKEEREHMVHTKPSHERGGERKPFGDVYARAHMVNVLPSSSTDDISPHHKMCFSNFENALIHKIDSYLPRCKHTPYGWFKPNLGHNDTTDLQKTFQRVLE